MCECLHHFCVSCITLLRCACIIAWILRPLVGLSRMYEDYPIVSIEDPFDQDDWENTKAFASLGACQVCIF